MNKTYGGLVSNPVNNNDTYVQDNRTITFQGVVIQTPTEIPEPQSEPQQEIPVIEVFSDADCTTYATGELDTVYVRINKDIELAVDPEYPGEGFASYGMDDSHGYNYSTVVFSYDNSGWAVAALVDFNSPLVSLDQPNPFKEGAVFECTLPAGIEPIDVTGRKTVFYESDRVD